MLFTPSIAFIGAAIVLLAAIIGVGPAAANRRASKPQSAFMSDHDIDALLDREFSSVSGRRQSPRRPANSTGQTSRHTGTPVTSKSTSGVNKSTSGDSQAEVRIVEAYIRAARRSMSVDPLLAVEVYEETGEDLGLVLRLYGPICKLLSSPNYS